MKKRNIKISANKIVEIYNSYLDSLNQVQKYQEKKNILSKQISTNSELNENEIKKISSDVKTLKENLENYKNESSKKK